MILLIAKAIGFRRLANWALWLIRMTLLVATFAVVLLIWFMGSTETRNTALGGAELGLIVGLVMWAVRALWKRRKGAAPEEVSQGPRTIDGKVVPDMLAVSALGVPQRSPDGDYVLRGLPDYGKMLLGLNSGDFAYVSEVESKVPLFLPVEKPAIERSPLVAIRWALGAVAVVCLVVGGLVIQSARVDANRARANIQDGPSLVESPTQEKSPIAEAPLSSPAPATLSEAAHLAPAPTVSTPTLAADAPVRSGATPRPVVKSPSAAPEATPRAEAAQDDVMKHFNEFKRVAEEGNPRAAYYLSLLYENNWRGIGVSETMGMLQSKYWLLGAAMQGDVKAQVRLGENYLKGMRGFDRNPQEGENWLKKAVAQAPESSVERRHAMELLDGLP